MTGAKGGLLLVAVGGMALWLVGTGRAVLYVKTGLFPFLVAAGGTLVLMGVASIVADMRAHGSREKHGVKVAMLVLVPVAIAMIVTPPALGAFTADGQAEPVQPGRTHFEPLPVGEPVPLTLLDYAERAELGHSDSLRGRTLRVQGFVTHDEHGRTDLAQLRLSCCAADASAIKIHLEGTIQQPADQWIEVLGMNLPLSEKGIARLHVLSLTPIETPENPYAAP